MVLIKAPPRRISKSFHTKVEGHRKSPGYVLHLSEVMRLLFLLATVLEVSSKEKRVMLESSKAVRFAITASVSWTVSPGKRETAASDTSALVVVDAGATTDSSTSKLFISHKLSLYDQKRGGKSLPTTTLSTTIVCAATKRGSKAATRKFFMVID